jgi:WD40 repeat protein
VAHRQTLGSRLAGHSGPVAAWAYSADGETLVSVDAAGTVTLWDLSRRLASASLALPYDQGLRSAALSADSPVLFSSALWGGRLIVTDLDPASWARSACDAANRDLTRDEWEQFVGAAVDYQPLCSPLAPAER